MKGVGVFMAAPDCFGCKGCGINIRLHSPALLDFKKAIIANRKSIHLSTYRCCEGSGRPG